MRNASRSPSVPWFVPFTTSFSTRPCSDPPDPVALALTETSRAVTRPSKSDTPRTRARAVADALPPRVDVRTAVPGPLADRVPDAST
jgi:hypothetical protein